MDIYETRKKLSELSDAFKEYRGAHKDVLTTKEEYIDLRTEKPEPRSTKEVKEPFDSAPIRVALLILMLLCAAICVSGLGGYFIVWLIGKHLPENLAFSIVLTIFSIFELLISGIGTMGISFFASLLIGEFIYSFISKHNYKKRVIRKKENESFNQVRLPRLIEEYEGEAERLSDEYDKKYAKACHKIDTCEDFFKENSSVIAKKYYFKLDEIIKVIDDQRASKLSDAINLILHDGRMERATTKTKKQKDDEGLYPLDILERMKVKPQRCRCCPNNEKCVKLFCRMNAQFDKKEDEEIEKELKENK